MSISWVSVNKDFCFK